MLSELDITPIVPFHFVYSMNGTAAERVNIAVIAVTAKKCSIFGPQHLDFPFDDFQISRTGNTVSQIKQFVKLFL